MIGCLYPSFPQFLNCTENWISNIGVGYIIPKIIAYVEIGYDFTKKCIKRLILYGKPFWRKEDL